MLYDFENDLHNSHVYPNRIIIFKIKKSMCFHLVLKFTNTLCRYTFLFPGYPEVNTHIWVTCTGNKSRFRESDAFRAVASICVPQDGIIITAKGICNV